MDNVHERLREEREKKETWTEERCQREFVDDQIRIFEADVQKLEDVNKAKEKAINFTVNHMGELYYFILHKYSLNI